MYESVPRHILSITSPCKMFEFQVFYALSQRMEGPWLSIVRLSHIRLLVLTIDCGILSKRTSPNYRNGAISDCCNSLKKHCKVLHLGGTSNTPLHEMNHSIIHRRGRERPGSVGSQDTGESQIRDSRSGRLNCRSWKGGTRIKIIPYFSTRSYTSRLYSEVGGSGAFSSLP